jgi:dTDP-4-dehydrorhamnose 3,5-epimerase
MGFRFEATELDGVFVIETDAYHDARGLFMETYRATQFFAHGIPPFVQDNRSRSRRHVLRGLHYQLPPHAQGKLVGVVRGEILDVAVDLRRDAPTFARAVAVILSEDNRRMLYIPPGCAHGFCVLSEEADVAYKVTREYAPAADRGIAWDDPELAIPWPVAAPVLSDKDRQYPRLAEVLETLPARREDWLT